MFEMVVQCGLLLSFMLIGLTFILLKLTLFRVTSKSYSMHYLYCNSYDFIVYLSSPKILCVSLLLLDMYVNIVIQIFFKY